MLTKLDLAYLAGFFDGDGCVSLSCQKDKTKVRKMGYQVQVSLTQNSPCAILDELRTEFGGKVYSNGKRCNALSWRCPAKSHVRFLTSILPYLRIKRTAAKIAIEYQRRVDKNPTYRPLTDEEWDARTALWERMQDTFDKRGLSMHSRAREQRGGDGSTQLHGVCASRLTERHGVAAHAAW